MIALFQNVYALIVALVQFVINSLQSLYVFIVNIPNYINFIISSISVLPNVLIPFCTISIYLAVVLLLLGRN